MTGFKPPTLNGQPIPYGASVAELQTATEKPGPKAWAAIGALAAKREAQALGVLTQLAHSPDPHLRRAAVEAIGMHPSGQTASEVVCQALHDTQAVIVRAATEAAANLKLRVAHERIFQLAEASEENTRLTALRALEKLWQPSDFEAVFARYRGDPSDPVRKQAAWTLHRNVGAEHWEQVFATWSKDTLPRHRVWACELAGRFGTEAVFPALEVLRADPDGHVRRAAQRATEQLGVG